MTRPGRRPQRGYALRLYSLAYVFFLYAPVLLLLLFSFNNSIYVAFPLKGFTLDWYKEMAHNPVLIAALKRSLLVATAVAFSSTLMGLLTAMAVTKYKLPGMRWVVVLAMTPLVIPSVILGVALLIVFLSLGLSLSLITIGIAHTVLCAPFAVMVLTARLEGFDRNLEEAAADLGETPWMTFWRVTFPLILPGLVASLLLTFTISFDEFVLAFFLSGNEATLPIYVWAQLRFPKNVPSMLALAASILIISFVLVSFAEWLRRRGVQQELEGLQE